MPEQSFKLEPVPYKSGDVLVITSERRITKDVADKLRERVEHAIPGVKALVLDSGINVQLLRRKDESILND